MKAPMQRHELGVVGGGAWVLGWQPKRFGSQNGLKGSNQKRRSSGKLTGPQVYFSYTVAPPPRALLFFLVFAAAGLRLYPQVLAHVPDIVPHIVVLGSCFFCCTSSLVLLRPPPSFLLPPL